MTVDSNIDTLCTGGSRGQGRPCLPPNVRRIIFVLQKHILGQIGQLLTQVVHIQKTSSFRGLCHPTLWPGALAMDPAGALRTPDRRYRFAFALTMCLPNSDPGTASDSLGTSRCRKPDWLHVFPSSSTIQLTHKLILDHFPLQQKYLFWEHTQGCDDMCVRWQFDNRTESTH